MLLDQKKNRPLKFSAYTLLTALGEGLSANWDCLLNKKSMLRQCDFEDVDIKTYIGRVKGIEDIKFPDDKIIAPGVIDSTTNFVEHPEVVQNRLVQFSKVINKDQLMAGTDCGFSTFAGFGNVDENIVYKKLESLVIGTEMASKII